MLGCQAAATSTGLAAALALLLGDAVDAGVILAIILLSGFLGFWRERGAAGAVQALVVLVRVEAEVRRDGRVRSLPLEEIVPGDVVVLNAGDLVPGDSLILQSNQLLVDEAAVTGEAYPVHKQPGVVEEATPLARRANCLFSGTHVVSGTAALEFALRCSRGARRVRSDTICTADHPGRGRARSPRW